MWKILILISNNRSGFLKCSSLVYSLLFVLILNWRKGRSAPAISYNEDLLSTTQLIQSLATSNYQDILKGKIPTEDSLPDSSWSTLKAILRQNINKFGNIYYRFVSREHITTN
ncbi:PREDICTED: uncharacterized protein LOC109581971 isoform X2 [Amphimedon queenslandica]|nr:PREDICTED: uncharacterized protein LOC109581971 isoform X2 [Amphimedon queenslandica]|eukprot:XP_019852061.1 PREDICTED: uncharacterized protein LOC109581971 isoform X2 [Amphimedon queenslandica]